MQLDFITGGAVPGSKQETTREGFLLCRDVAIARTGTMQYAAGETPVQDSNGWVDIFRDADEVFKPASMASMNGKPVTDNHPWEDVTPDNWSRLARGTVHNVRRGTGDKADLLFADLLVMDAALIRDIKAGKREVSCGYSAEYLQDAPGRGRQVDIQYNHLALVDRGRCGPRCAIGDRHPGGSRMAGKTSTIWDALKKAFSTGDADYFDAVMRRARDESDDDDPDNLHNHPDAHATGEKGDMHHIEIHNHLPGNDSRGRGRDDQGETDPDAGNPGGEDPNAPSSSGMATTLNKGWGDRRAKGKDMTEEEKAEAEKKDREREEAKDAKFAKLVADAVVAGLKAAKDTEGVENEGDPTNKKILSEIELEMPPGTQQSAADARDSAPLADSVADTLALGATIAPGYRMPAFDRAWAPKRTVDALCEFRRDVLAVAQFRPETRSVVGDALGGRDLAKASCGDVRAAFRAVGAVVRSQGRDSAVRFSDTAGGLPIAKSRKVQSVADIQERADEFYAKQRSGAAR